MLQNRFKKILVSLDGSLNSVKGFNQAISLARQTQGEITGVHVLPHQYGLSFKQSTEYKNQSIKFAKKFLEKAKIDAARNGLDFVGKILSARNATNAIVGFANKNKFDIIIIGSRGLGSSTQHYIGSTANGIINSSRIPVLVVK